MKSSVLIHLLVVAGVALFGSGAASGRSLEIENQGNTTMKIESAYLLDDALCKELRITKLVLMKYDHILFVTNFSGKGNDRMRLYRRDFKDTNRPPETNVPVLCPILINFEPLEGHTVTFNNYTTVLDYQVAAGHGVEFRVTASDQYDGSGGAKNIYTIPSGPVVKYTKDPMTLFMSLGFGGREVYPCGKKGVLYLEVYININGRSNPPKTSEMRLWGDLKSKGKTGPRLSFLKDKC